MKTEVLVPSLKDSSICIHNPHHFKSGYNCSWHIHKECEIFLLTEGEKTFLVNEKEFPLFAGDIIFINENIPHKAKVQKSAQGTLMQMRMEFGSSNINKHLFRYISHSGGGFAVFKAGTDENIQIRQCIENILKENSDKRKSYDMFIKSEIYKIFAILYRYDIIKDPLTHFNTKDISRILPVLEFVDTHYSEPISLNQISSILNVDKSHFCRIFKKAVNTSFVQYLNFVRVLKAEKMLLSTDKSISQIAEETGFSSSAYFSETFKQNMSCSPTHYKNIKLTSR